MADQEIRHYYDGSYYALYLDYSKSVKEPLSWSAFMESKPFWVYSSHKVVSCICVHHRSMLIRAKALAALRSKLHKHGGGEGCEKDCPHDDSCKCKCKLCSATSTGASLSDFKDRIMCPRQGTRRHYNVACVLGKCKSCGFERNLGCCPIEEDRKNQMVKAKVLGKVSVDTPRGPKKMMAEVCALYCAILTHVLIIVGDPRATRAQVHGGHGKRSQEFQEARLCGNMARRPLPQHAVRG